ncbi:unnamed protein product [Prorocentrum cordatum]|uniref:Uncharacterized protein n=1 Tax=Prorocentrum cordatum TaxID=2364126 RepID=A0ABN9PQ40_9DINO|nr:unnamed protein product [Polarella glacialis]
MEMGKEQKIRGLIQDNERLAARLRQLDGANHRLSEELEQARKELKKLATVCVESVNCLVARSLTGDGRLVGAAGAGTRWRGRREQWAAVPQTPRVSPPADLPPWAYVKLEDYARFDAAADQAMIGAAGV